MKNYLEKLMAQRSNYYNHCNQIGTVIETFKTDDKLFLMIKILPKIKFGHHS